MYDLQDKISRNPTNRCIFYVSDRHPPAFVQTAASLLRSKVAQAHIYHLLEVPEISAACLVPVLTRNDLDSAFKNCRLFRNSGRLTTTPIVLINANLALPESVAADFEELGCRVLFSEEPAALAQTLALMHCIEHRTRHHGPIITWDFSDMPILQGTRGRSREVNLSEAELATLKALKTSSRVFSRHELAAVTGYKPNEIQMFIQRIREKFKGAARWVGLKVAAGSIIRTIRGEGYRLVVRIRYPE